MVYTLALLGNAVIGKYAFLFLFCVLTAVAGCVSTSPPNKEYAIAQNALLVAKKFEAQTLSPKTYSQALSAYNKAMVLYKKKNYDRAKNFFEICITLAEKAEFKARIERLKMEQGTPNSSSDL